MTTTTALIDKPGIVHNLPDAAYHADPTPHGSLSSTVARRLLEEPPAKVLYDLNNRIGKRAFDVGHVLHTKVLGVGAPIVTYPDEHLTPSGSPSTKAATVAWEDEQRAAGLAIISRRDMTLVDAMAEAVLAHPTARKLLEQAGHSEVSAFGIDPDTGTWMRARYDRLTDDYGLDLKSTAHSASPAGFGREAARRGYPIQEAHYTATLEAAGHSPVPMRFVVVEKAAPHLVAVHEFDSIDRTIATDLAARARDIYADAQANGWHGHGDQILTPVLPGWWGHDDDLEEMEIH